MKKRVGIDARRLSPRDGVSLIAEFIRQALPAADGPFLLAVGGPGGAGKSHLCRELQKALGDVTVLGLDHYRTPRAERKAKKIFGPHPDANQFALLIEHVRQLKQGGAIEQPRYDPVTGRQEGTVRFTPGTYTLLDGETATYPGIREEVDLVVYVDADWQTILAARTTRDVDERKYTAEKVVETFLHSNLREYPEHGADGIDHADIYAVRHGDHWLEVQQVSEHLWAKTSVAPRPSSDDRFLQGLMVAVPVPFGPDEWIDEEAFAAHLGFLEQRGVCRVLVNGTTGEFDALSETERHRVFDLVSRHFAGAVVYQAGRESAVATESEVAWAQRRGADAVALLMPYYRSGLSEEGLVRYLQRVTRNCTIPVMLYNYPAMTGNPITSAILDAVPHAALKDSAANLALVPHTPRYLVGGDLQILEAQERGAAGWVSGFAAAFPVPHVALERAIADGDKLSRAAEHRRVAAIVGHLKGVRQVAAIKDCVAQQIEGYPTTVRLPLLPLPEAERIRIREWASGAATG